MKSLLNSATIVILAKNFNPSIVTKDWLLSRGILRETTIINFVHLPRFSLVESENFVITIDDSRFEVKLKNIQTSNREGFQDIALTFAEKLPETPFTGIGLNYIWWLEVTKDKNIFEMLKEEFVSDSQRFSYLFGQEFSVGGFIYFQYNNFKVRVTVEPSPDGKHIQFNFNYHVDIHSVEGVKDTLSRNIETFQHSEKIVMEFFKG